MSTELERLFGFEATKLEPLFITYKQSPSVAAGRAYNGAAGPWLRDATAALQAAPDSDPWKERIGGRGGRFDIVVRSMQTITDAGHGLDPTSGEIARQFVSDTATGFENNIRNATSFSLDWASDFTRNAAWIVGGIAVLYVAVRVLR